MSDKSLDISSQEFQKILNKSSGFILELFSNIYKQKGYHDFPQSEVERWFDEPLPEEGADCSMILDEVKTKVLDTATGNAGPNMYAYVMAGGTQVSIVADQLASAINQNQGKWHLGPAVNEMEKRVLSWGASMLDLDSQMGGILLSGGSAANLAGLTVARNVLLESQKVRKKGLFNSKPLIVYASREVHGCIDKSVELLGIGTEQLRKIETNPDFSISLDSLVKQIEKDEENGYQPFCVIGNAGTVNTGAIDDLEVLSAIAREKRLWFHVDGAYGGLAASLPALRPKYAGIEKADSVAIDFHKWLYQPFEAGCILVKDWETLKKAYFKEADYLDNSLETDSGRWNFNEYHFQLSKSTKSLKIWMSLKVYGMIKFREMIKKDIELAHYLAEQVEKSDDFELMSKSELAITCFRYIGSLKQEEEIIAINQKLVPALEKDGRIFITATRLNGKFAIRACVINHRKQMEDIDYLLDVIKDVACKLL